MQPAIVKNGKERARGKTVRTLLVPYGTWLGHSAGPQTYGSAECEAMVQYYNSTHAVNGKPLQIDYEHQSLDYGLTGPVPAAGWIWALYHVTEGDDPGVYGDVEWTDRAAEAIKANEYRYISPVIAVGKPDPVTGKPVPVMLFNAALTNMPFMADRMNAVVANGSADAASGALYMNTFSLNNQLTQNSQGGSGMDLQKLWEDLKGLLKLAADATPDDAIRMVKAMGEFLKGAPGNADPAAVPGPDVLPTMQQALNKLVANSKAYEDLAKLVEADATKDGDVLARVAAMKNTAAAAPDAAKLAALEARLAGMEADELLAANAGKIAPKDREFWRNRAISDLAGTKEVLDRMPDVIPNATPASRSASQQGERVYTDTDRKLGLTPEDVKKFSATRN